METNHNATALEIDILAGIHGSRYDGDLGPNSFGQDLFPAESTWQMVGFDVNGMSINPKNDLLAHFRNVPTISFDGCFSTADDTMHDISPTSFSSTSFHGGIQGLQCGASWDRCSQQSDGYCSTAPGLQCGSSWDRCSQQSDGYCSTAPGLQNESFSDMLSQHSDGYYPMMRNDSCSDMLSQDSDGNHSMMRSTSFEGSVDTQMMNGLHDPMTTSTTTLQAKSLPIPFEDRHYNSSLKPESVSSGESFSEMQTESGAEFQNSLQLTFYKVAPNENTGAMVATATAEGKKPRGRHGPLKPQQREEAARMRKTGSCDLCRRRKSKCDGGIFCSACVKYYKGKRPPHPCREQPFESLSEILLRGHVFPKRRPLVRYVGNEFSVEKDIYRINLNLGFGTPFPADIKLVKLLDIRQLIHRHVVYPWKPGGQTTIAKKESSLDYVFPAVLANTDSLITLLDDHISLLLDDRSNFDFFPLYRSELQVLPHIYFYYKTLTGDMAKPLRHALKLLILVHIGGDMQLDEDGQIFAHRIVSRYFSDIRDSVPVVALPCFIRGQLGPIFSGLAASHMKVVLSFLEKHSSGDDYKRFPIILSTFAVLFMAIESIQYHAAKESYHASIDSDEDRETERTYLDANENEGVENLLNFYKACFGECHAKLHDGIAGFQYFAAASSSNARESETTVTYLKTLKAAIDKARPYLNQKRKATAESKDDMSFYFDRLLAKLFLITSKA